MADPDPKFMTVPATHPVFAGHFPGRPIVPGVMLLEWVLDEIAQRRQCTPGALRVREAKFFTPLGPGQTAELRLDLGDARCAFSIHREASAIARGIVDWSTGG